MSERVAHVDVARGLGALLVVAGHNWLVWGACDELHDVIFSLHMPLFFVLSGVFFRPDESVRAVARARAGSLLKPYAVTFTLLAIDDVLLAPEPDPLRYFGGLAYGSGHTIPWTPLWFLPHLFALSGLVLAFHRASRFGAWPRWAQAGFVAGAIVLGGYGLGGCGELPIPLGAGGGPVKGLPFSLDLLPVTGGFFLAGHLLRERILRRDDAASGASPRSPGERGVVPIALAIFAGIHALTDTAMDLNQRRYDDGVITSLAAATGVLLALALARLLARAQAPRRALGYVGGASLFVLVFHHPAQFKTYELLDRLLPSSRPLVASIAFLVGCAVPLVLYELIRRVRPLRALYLP